MSETTARLGAERTALRAQLSEVTEKLKASVQDDVRNGEKIAPVQAQANVAQNTVFGWVREDRLSWNEAR